MQGAGSVGGLGVLLALAFVLCSCGKESRTSCYANLKIIEGAKATLEIQGRRTNGSIITSNELMTLLQKWPKCPMDGTYTINPIGTPPTCSWPEHELN